MLSLLCLSLLPPISGALASFIYATSLGFYKSPSRLLLRVVLLGLLHIGPSRARYTNNGYPKGIPMSVAPECLGKSKICVETQRHDHLQRRGHRPEDNFSIGCATSAPDGSSPRVYGPVFAPRHRLKLYYSMKNLTIFLGAAPLFIDSCWRT